MSSSGVLHVHKHVNKKDFYWQYQYEKNGKLKTIYEKSLFALERRVKFLNLPWIVKDEKKYEENISRDLECLNDFCILNDFSIVM